MSPKILVTGAGGYIGSIATSLLLSRGYDVVALDNFSTGYRAPLELLQNTYGKSRLHIVKADLTGDLSPVFKTNKHISAVLHFAAACSVDESMHNPEKYFTNNVVGSHNLLTAMMHHGIHTIIFSSTCAVYGDAKYVPVDEVHPTIPANPYGESKLITEREIAWYGKLTNLRYLIFRYFNVCGATDDGSIGDSKKPSSLLVQNAVRGALGISPFSLTCPKVSTPDHTPIRDYINVVDLCDAHIKGLEYLSKKKESTVINLGTGTGNSVREILTAVKNTTGKSFSISKTTPRRGEYPTMIAATVKAQKLLGWHPTHTIADSISSLVSWYTTHPSGWKK